MILGTVADERGVIFGSFAKEHLLARVQFQLRTKGWEGDRRPNISLKRWQEGGLCPIDELKTELDDHQ